MTSSLCTCQSPSRRWKSAADGLSSRQDEDTEELQPLPNGFSHEHDVANDQENEPCLFESEPVQTVTKTERRQRINSVWQYYLEHNTLHGLHFVFDTKSIWRKCIWVAILLIAGGLFFSEVQESIKLYFQYPFTTQATVYYPNKIGLPAISICDLRDARKTILSNSKLRLTRDSTAGDISKGLNSDLTLNDVLQESSTVLNETLISCAMRRGVTESYPCYGGNFTLFLTSDGHTCFTFNTGVKDGAVLEADNVGSLHGVHMVLNTQPLEEGNVYGGSGIKVILHHQDELPLRRVGFHVSPGYVTYIDMKKQQIKNLPKPFSTNCNGRKLDYFLQYSRNKCFLEEITKHVTSKCGCRGWFMPETRDNASVCSLKKTLDCMWPAWDEWEHSNVNNCPVDCDELNYEAQLSTALYVPQRLLPLKKHSYLLQAKHMPNDTEGRVQFILDYYVVLSLYYSELKVEVVEQTPSFGFFSLLGEVGGQLALVLGASFITILEVVDLTIMIAINLLWPRTRRRNTDT